MIFKTAAFNHSATSPRPSKRSFCADSPRDRPGRLLKTHRAFSDSRQRTTYLRLDRSSSDLVLGSAIPLTVGYHMRAGRARPTATASRPGRSRTAGSVACS